MLVIRDPRLTAVQVLDLELVLAIELLEFLLDVRDDKRLDQLRGLRWDDAARAPQLKRDRERTR